MADAANLTYKQLRIMRPFLIADDCNILNSEHEIRKLEIHSKIEPIFKDVKEDKVNRKTWRLPVVPVVNEIASAITGAPANSELHIILGADHGQGAWRAALSLVLIDSSQGRVIQQKHQAIACIECRKDKRQVLVDSGIPAAINQELHAIKGASINGMLVKIMATGDLAWFSEALGKSNMSGNHCHRCRWKRGEKPRHHCNAWTLERLKTHLERLHSGELNKADKAVESGVVATPLIDAIEPQDYIIGPLHCVTLFINTPFKYLHRWIWNRVEAVPEPLIEARDRVANADIQVKLWQEDLADNDEPDQIAAIKAELKAAKAELKQARAEVAKMEKNSKEYGTVTQDLWMAIQNRLKEEFQVYISSYHGGDMEGNQCRQLMKKAVPVMDMIEEMALEYLDMLSAEHLER
jgi:hypothetical protein